MRLSSRLARLLSAALLGLAPLAAPALGQDASRPVAEPPAGAMTVTLARVQSRQAERLLRGDGSVVSWQELVIGAETGGLRVMQVDFEEGDLVRQGQLLVQLQDAVPRAQAAQARAAVAEADSALVFARADLKRAQELQRGDFAARQVLDQRQANAAAAEARLLSARATLEEAETRLAQTRILAPSAGRISRRAILPGAVITMGQEMLRLIRDDRIELDAKVPELDLAAIAPGQMVRVLHGDRVVEGRVRAVAPIVLAESRLGIVHVALPPDSGLRPGMFARAEIIAGHAEAPALPREAVLHRDGRAIAFVLEGDRVRLRRLELGPADAGGWLEVRGGVSVGERVVVAGAGFLSEGLRVRVAEPAK